MLLQRHYPAGIKIQFLQLVSTGITIKKTRMKF